MYMALESWFIYIYIYIYIYNVLILTKKRPLGIPKRRWEDWTRIDLREIGRGCGVDPVGSG